jgi:RND family efflux transporter MFP subunit
VRENLATLLAEASDVGRGLSRYVERDFARYLECGVLAHGFARVRCGSCKDELLVAFSCKGRGVCPSCNAKRAQVTAVHLVERVLPRMPYRQWTLSFPHRVRCYTAETGMGSRQAMRCGRGSARAGVLSALLWVAGGSALAQAPESAPSEQVLSAQRPLLGVVVASQVLDLVSELEGRLSEVNAHLGQRVEAGEVVAALDPEPLRLELGARQSNVRASEALSQRATIVLAQARQRLEREQRIRDFSAAEAEETARGEVALAEADLQLAQAQLASTKARMAQAERDVRLARLKAPFTGTVTEQYLTPGMRVSAATPVLRLVSEQLRLRFAVPERLAPGVRPGDTVRVRLATVGVELTATVDRLSPEVELASRHQKAEALLQVPAALRGQLASGLVAEVYLQPNTRGQSRVATTP